MKSRYLVYPGRTARGKIIGFHQCSSSQGWDTYYVKMLAVPHIICSCNLHRAVMLQNLKILSELLRIGGL